MHKENILKLANFIEQHSQPIMFGGKEYSPFSMSSISVPDCETAACIGGFAAALWPDCAEPCYYTRTGLTFDHFKVADKLGLDRNQICALCYPIDTETITRAAAIAALRNLAETGEVDFERTERPIR